MLPNSSLSVEGKTLLFSKLQSLFCLPHVHKGNEKEIGLVIHLLFGFLYSDFRRKWAHIEGKEAQTHLFRVKSYHNMLRIQQSLLASYLNPFIKLVFVSVSVEEIYAH